MKLAVFDVDGTLTKTMSVDNDCFIQACIEVFGINSFDNRWSDYEYVSDLGIFREIFRRHKNCNPNHDETARFVQRHNELLEEKSIVDKADFEEIPGAISFLTSLKPPCDWIAAIAAGGWRSTTQFKLRTAGFDLNQIPGAFAEDGPAREAIVQKAIERAMVHYQTDNYERIVLLGDAVWDVQTAIESHLPFVGVEHNDCEGRSGLVGASHVLQDFLDQKYCLRCLDDASVPLNIFE